MRNTILSGLLAAILSAPAAAQPAPNDAFYRRLNQDMVERHMLPRYQAFAAATAALEVAGNACTTAPETLVPAFHAAMDAWMAIEHVRIGPAQLDMRSDRIEYWPDRRNTGSRQLDQLLAQRPDGVTAASLAQGSVALQGFPALERLLFIEAEDGLDGFECALVAAITENVAAMGREVVAEWTAPDGDAAMIAAAGEPNSYYASPRDVSADIYQGLYEFFVIVTDHKLGRPLGESPDDANPRLAESWRSGRSLRNLAINFQAALDLFAGGDGFGYEDALIEAGDPELAAEIRTALEKAIAIAAAIELPLPDAVVDPEARIAVEQLHVLADTVREYLGAEMGSPLGLTMGFNSLDGD